MAKASQYQLGDFIKLRRTQAALTQAELAERLGVSQALVSNWESNKFSPSSTQVGKVESIIGELSDLDSEEADAPTAISAWLSRYMAERKLTATELAARSKLSVMTIYNLLNGRAENPQSRTLISLEKALGVKFETDSIAKGTIGPGVGELIDFNPYEHPPTAAGVYVLYDISQRPIYVGEGSNISKRIRDHEEKFWFKRPLVENAAYVEIPDEKLRRQVETVLIRFLKNNAVINKNKTARD